jgi:AraC-like DNA-binding protein
MKMDNTHFPAKMVNLPDFGILVESRRHRPAFANNLHTHDHLSILYVVSGEGILEYQKTKYDLASNAIITLNKSQPHKFLDKPKKPMTVFSTYFDIEKAGSNKFIVDYLFNSEIPFILPTYYAEQVKKNLRQILYEQNTKPPGYELAIKQNFSLAILQIYRAKLELAKQTAAQNPPDSLSRTKTVLDFIAANCHEQYTLNDAARMANVSQRQFTNLCRRLIQKSYVKFLNSQRCQKARNLIQSTDMTIASVAFEVGYEDISTFYRAFKCEFKCSPTKIR